MVKPIPEGAHNVIPHLVVRDAERALKFYDAAFNAHEVSRFQAPGSKTIMHAEIRLGDSRIYLNDEMPEMGSHSPKHLKGTPVTIHLWCENVDVLFKQAVAAGCKVKMPLMDQFWGDRYGLLEDPFGHMWSIATHVADYSPAEMASRAQESFASMPPPRPKKSAGRAKKARKVSKARPKAKKVAKKKHK